MTALSADTAELPRVRRPIVPGSAAGPLVVTLPAPGSVPAPVTLVTPGPASAGDAGPGRVERRKQRLQARRLRRIYALLGLAVLGGMLAATVTVLNVIH